MPANKTVWGLPPPVSVMYRIALRAPVCVGSKVAVIVQFAPAPSDDGQLLLSEKSPGSKPCSAHFVMSRGTLPVFVSCTRCGGLMVPTFCDANVKLDGESVTTVPAPESSMTSGFEEALSITVISPVCVPCITGANEVLIWHSAPASRDFPYVLLTLN